MRGIAGKDDTAMDELVHAPALELVERNPFEIERSRPAACGSRRRAAVPASGFA
ncbi:MAG: hypothetical protein U1E61_15730 [Bradyrhizobium sp.]